MCTSLTTQAWFRTGDVASVDPCGWITIIDRSKNIIVTGGENVFCHEVEASLCTHPRITEAAVYGVADRILGEAVEAAVCCDVSSLSHVFEQNIIAHCRSTLASFKVPRRIVLQRSMPRTSTGKIEKGKLQRHAIEATTVIPTYHRSRTSRLHDVTFRDDLIKLIQGKLISL